jgi:hypothetical protein
MFASTPCIAQKPQAYSAGKLPCVSAKPVRLRKGLMGLSVRRWDSRSTKLPCSLVRVSAIASASELVKENMDTESDLVSVIYLKIPQMVSEIFIILLLLPWLTWIQTIANPRHPNRSQIDHLLLGQ